MSQFIVGRDANLTPDFGIGFANGSNFQLIGNDPDLIVTIPTNFDGIKTVTKVLINISKGQDVFVALNNTIILPVPGTETVTTLQTLNPSLRIDVRPGDDLHFRSRDDADVQLEYFTEEV